MLLGTVLEMLDDEAFALETLVGLGDLRLLAHVQSVAEEHGLEVGTVITKAVHAFTSNADADNWVQLMGAINRADDPGAQALRQMLEVVLPRN